MEDVHSGGRKLTQWGKEEGSSWTRGRDKAPKHNTAEVAAQISRTCSNDQFLQTKTALNYEVIFCFFLLSLQVAACFVIQAPI